MANEMMAEKILLLCCVVLCCVLFCIFRDEFCVLNKK